MIKMMTASQPPHDAAKQHSVAIRALSSITSDQTDIIAKAVRASGLAWAVHTSDDYDGYLSILIEPIDPGGSQKSFFIAGTKQKLDLFEAFEDDMTLVASFDDVEAISDRLLDLIA